MSIKMRKKLGVGEMPCTRQQIRHYIIRARNVVPKGDIAKITLVQRLEAEQERSGASSCGGAFALPIYRRRVVIRIVDGTFRNVGRLCEDIVLCNGTSEFEITVGDIAIGVFERN